MALAIPVAMLAIGAATSAAAASAKNKAIKQSMQSQKDSAAVQDQQVQDAGSVEQLKIKNEAEMIRSRLRVAGADSGTGDGSTALLQQAAYDEALNQNIIDRNIVNERRKLSSGLTASLTELHSQVSNGLLAALSGGAQGFSTGLQIQSLMPKPDVQPPGAKTGGMGADIEWNFLANPGGNFE